MSNFLILDGAGFARATATQLPDAVDIAYLFGHGSQVLVTFNGIAFRDCPLLDGDLPEDRLDAQVIAKDRHKQWIKLVLPSFMVFSG